MRTTLFMLLLALSVAADPAASAARSQAARRVSMARPPQVVKSEARGTNVVHTLSDGTVLTSPLRKVSTARVKPPVPKGTCPCCGQKLKKN